MRPLLFYIRAALLLRVNASLCLLSLNCLSDKSAKRAPAAVRSKKAHNKQITISVFIIDSQHMDIPYLVLPSSRLMMIKRL